MDDYRARFPPRVGDLICECSTFEEYRKFYFVLNVKRVWDLSFKNTDFMCEVINLSSFKKDFVTFSTKYVFLISRAYQTKVSIAK